MTPGLSSLDRSHIRSSSISAGPSRLSNGSIPTSKSICHRFSSPNLNRSSPSPAPSSWSKKQRSSSVFSRRSHTPSLSEPFDLSTTENRKAARKQLEQQRLIAEERRITEEKRLSEEKLIKERKENLERWRIEMESIIGKWEKYAVENDGEDEDEIILGRTDEEMIIVKNRGKVEKMSPREFAGESEEDDEDEGVLELQDGSILDEDDENDDPLGGWGEDSGLDEQEFEDDEEQDEVEKVGRVWTKEDDMDLALFLKAEAGRRVLAGEDTLEDEGEEEGQDGDISEEQGYCSTDFEIGSEGEVGLNDLFPEDESEDELLAQTSDAEEATRITPIDFMNDTSIVSPTLKILEIACVLILMEWKRFLLALLLLLHQNPEEEEPNQRLRLLYPFGVVLQLQLLITIYQKCNRYRSSPLHLNEIRQH